MLYDNYLILFFYFFLEASYNMNFVYSSHLEESLA